MDAVQKHRGTTGVISAVVAWSLRSRHLVEKIADDHDLVFERLQGRQYRRELERSFIGRSPVAHHRAVWHETQPKTELRIRSGFRQRRLGRQHRLQQRQGQCHSHAAEERAAGKVFLGDDRHLASFNWKGVLFTMPSTMDEKRKLLLRASCTILRTAGIS